MSASPVAESGAAFEGSGATAVVPPPPHRGPSPGHALRLPAVVVIVGLTLAAIGIGGAAIGELLPTRVLMLLAVGALLAHARPELRVAIACGTGVLALAMMNPTFSVYFVALVGSLTIARRHTVVFLAVLVSAAILAPKTAFVLHYHHPGYWNWINEPSLTVALLVSVLWLRTRARPAPGTAPPQDDALSFALYYMFPSHATNPMPYSPVLLSRPRLFDARAILTLLAWFVAKAATLVALRRFGHLSFLTRLGPGDLDTLARSDLWVMVILSYVETCLSLAATADIPVLIGRLFGFTLPDPFRLPLLAGNPVELWRRWGIYNRHVLLQLVYFPLGGGRRRKYLNVMLTFLASALLLHSGWFGSKYWHVGTAGWRDQSIYFLLQGLAVCACLAVWDWSGKNARTRTAPRLSLALLPAIVVTQGWSALVHVTILAPNIALGDRARLVARCLGLA